MVAMGEGVSLISDLLKFSVFEVIGVLGIFWGVSGIVMALKFTAWLIEPGFKPGLSFTADSIPAGDNAAGGSAIAAEGEESDGAIVDWFRSGADEAMTALLTSVWSHRHL